MKSNLAALFFMLLLPVAVTAQTSLDTLSLKSIFYPPLLAGNRPDFTTFSPDGTSVYYRSNDSARSAEKLFRVSIKQGRPEEAPESFESHFIASPGGKRIVYEDHHDIWVADTSFTHKRKIVDAKARDYNPRWSPDGKSIAYVQKGNVWIVNLSNSGITQVTDKQKDAPGYSIESWAGNGWLILSQRNTSDYKTYYFPEYLDTYVDEGATRRGIATRIISAARLDSGTVRRLDKKHGFINSSVSSSGRYLALDIMDAPRKHRTIRVFDLKRDTSRVVFQDSTRGWIYGTNLSFAPEGSTLMFKSERDGWNHIYTINPDGSDLQQQTDGNFEVPWARWTDGQHIAYASTETDPGERQLYELNISNHHHRKLTSMRGFRQHFHLGPNKKQIVYQYTYFNEPFELYELKLDHPEEKRLTFTTPARFKKINWQKEDYLRFTGRDGHIRLSMSVLKPLHKKPDQSYPVVVFVHGAGTLQNVYKGWSDHYYREYMFNQYLTAHGYYVMEVDYRQSTGYGRKFREDVTGWLGKYEAQDIEGGINYLAAHYSGADTSRVGIYGGSYGGFMSLYATSVASGYFDAAAALRAVTNWKNYYHTNPWYTRPRLGTPEVDSANYARSSPITYVDQLKRPVLLLHGLKDNNVGFQDAAQYINKLIQAGNKDFRMMMYPAERHSFHDPDDWYDEYARIYRFFEEQLRGDWGVI